MAQLFKLFCFVTSVLLLLQLADAVIGKTPSKRGNESNGQAGEEYKAPFLINVEKITNSKPIRVAKKHLNNFSRDFKSNLNTESKKHVNDDNSFILNIVKNNVILPGKAVAQTSIDTLNQPIRKMVSNVKNNGITKSKQIADKSVSFLKASKSIVGNKVGGMFGKASSFWRRGKNDKGVTAPGYTVYHRDS